MIPPEATVHYDSDAGIVRSKFTGLMTIELLAEYELALQRAVATARRSSSCVLFIFDSQESVVQPADIIARMRAIGDSVYRAGDRRAVVVGSVLLKMQAARAVQGNEGENVVRTTAEGEAWLKS